jgi:ppGpp synthetase/RelA/SpoT-type nucleotidyltranferase
MNDSTIDSLVALYEERRHIFKRFLNNINDFFLLEPSLNEGSLPIIHSIKHRLKDPEHLRKKLARKISKGKMINCENLFSQVTDLAGIRILHLHRKQFEPIHNFIMQIVAQGDWVLGEQPVAYMWDPEIEEYFKSFDLRTEVKETFYTSVHYIVQSPSDSRIQCEIQVRNLFEEAWGEIDHAINYPQQTTSHSCLEQIRVLSKLVGAGSRLADSIFSEHSRSCAETHSESEQLKESS